MHQYVPLSQLDDSDNDLDAELKSRTNRQSINQSIDHAPIDNQPLIDRSRQSKSVLYTDSKKSPVNFDRPPFGVLVMAISLLMLGLSLILLSLPWPQSINQSLLNIAKSQPSISMLVAQAILSLRIFSWYRAISIPIGMFLVVSGGYTVNEFAHYREQHRHPGGYLFPRYK